MSNRTLRRWLVVAGAVVVLALVAFGPQVVDHFTKKAAGPALATASLRSFPVDVTATGTLVPRSLVTVNFSTDGQVSEIDTAVGATVTQGQLLAKLNSSSQQAALSAAQTALASAQTELSVARSVSSPNPSTIASLTAQVANAQSEVTKAQAALAATVVTAPEAGTVLEINAQVGNTVRAGTTGVPAVAGSSGSIVNPQALSSNNSFMVIGSNSNYEVSAAFSQRDATELQAGQTGSVSFDALPGLNFPCHVVSVATGASTVNGVPQFYAAVTPDQTDPRLRTGMTAFVTINITSASDVLAVPNQAVILLNGSTFVDVWSGGRAVATQVTTGLTGTQLTQITSGLSDGEQVLLTPQQPLPTAGSGPRSSGGSTPAPQ